MTDETHYLSRVPTRSLLRQGHQVTDTARPKPDVGRLSGLAPELAQTFASLTTDIALILDDQGIIKSVSNGGTTAIGSTAQEWVGRAWADTVTGETRSKIDQLLKEVASTGFARRREINHPSDQGNISVAYTAMRLGKNGPMLAIGRDLGAIAAIQQRFVDTQQLMERSYWQLRQDEARYRLLFQVATDAVMVVDSLSLDILEANQAAAQLLDMEMGQLVGRHASFGFERHSRVAVESLLETARSSGQASEIRARLLGRVSATSVSATPFKTNDAVRLIVRLRTMDLPGTASALSTTLARMVDSASDGVLVTDTNGCIMMANPAFLKLINKSTEAEVKTRPLSDWISVSDDQFATVMQEVRHFGIARRMSSQLLSGNATCSNVEVTAALLTEGEQECIGFTLHAVAGSVEKFSPSTDQLRVAIEELTARIGIETLPDLLRKASTMLERYFICSAMEREGDNPKAAADLLGIRMEQLDSFRPDVCGPRLDSPPKSF